MSLEWTGASPLNRRDADFDSVRTRLTRPYIEAEWHKQTKYFHESTFDQHYDGRFADRPLKYYEKQEHLSSLVQTYLTTMNEIGAESWLMHGTLLGWYWNRRVMPWDSDIDVMVSETSIELLARYYNMSMHHFKIPGTNTARKYMLEVNPHCFEGDIDKENRIDARWIDTDIGLFIDITTLRHNDTATAEGNDESMMVKDRHHYLYDDIYPLREGVFESMPAWIPYSYADILIEEYGDQALSDIYHDHHRFDPEKGEWVPQKQAVLSTSDFDEDKPAVEIT
ncbi:uncharacterized protein MYCFIDRAFT_47014 [Pseudocercospora fijiensis CIRAD86]|uniref:LicD/FKTN/FKRP nucleotidyltransferase domain-containing protein n=1 Tax=Pseudocercospora fijiensis (strain CIRAD86) TaxID=383855 RepID=M3B1C7_PSEFD|nr:uncharacterized protein MYCFIDRAFT_47014 [Pseudocercospora fijiensis CIRAD86]EME83163.1 hypothetical protein MYCFIDRAFT_47014 [Pseudocercospora fijiensis CIRAD86]